MKKSIKSNKYSSAEKETSYLLKSPKNAERLKLAINDFEANKNLKQLIYKNSNEKNFRN